MTLTLIDMFTFRFHSDSMAIDGINGNGFQIEYSTQNCGDGSNNICNIGMADENADHLQIISFVR